MSGIIGRIYKITSNETDYIYIGSTTNQLDARFKKHKADYKRHSDNKSSYLSSFEIIKYTDAKIELIHEGLFEGRNDLENYERDTIRTSPNCVNIYKKKTDEEKKRLNKYVIIKIMSKTKNSIKNIISKTKNIINNIENKINTNMTRNIINNIENKESLNCKSPMKLFYYKMENVQIFE